MLRNCVSFSFLMFAVCAFGQVRTESARTAEVEVIPLTVATVPPRNWPIFDSLQHTSKPDLGLAQVMLLDRQCFVSNEAKDRTYSGISAQRTFEVAQQARLRGVPVIIDIEHWPTDIRQSEDAALQQAHEHLGYVVDLLRRESPSLRIGVYGIMPPRDFWTPATYHEARRRVENWDQLKREPNELPRGWWVARLNKTKAQMDQWHAAAERFKTGGPDQNARGLAERVDVVYPSLYLFYDLNKPGELQKAEDYVRENIRLARTYGRDVYPFVWWFYHDSNKELGDTRVPAEAFRRLMGVVREEADGVVLWGGWQQPWTSADKELLEVVYDVDRQYRAQRAAGERSVTGRSVPLNERVTPAASAVQPGRR